jgi:hypothetical protein
MARKLKHDKLSLSSNIYDLEAIAEVGPLMTQEIDLKVKTMLSYPVRERSNSNGTKDLSLHFCWKEFRI